VELLLTVTLLGIVVSYIVINVEGMIPTYRMEGAARELGATVAEVQAQAAVRGRTHGIVYDLSSDSYWILTPREEEEGSEDEDKKKNKPVELDSLTPRKLHDGVRFKDISLGGQRKKLNGRVKILFDPEGTGMPHSIHLEGRDEKAYTIEVNPFSGTVEFFEGYRKFDLFLDEEDE
jgi:type II secretory pathway pseudopilin PulG